jgi:hypothetical protein
VVPTVLRLCLGTRYKWLKTVTLTIRKCFLPSEVVSGASALKQEQLWALMACLAGSLLVSYLAKLKASGRGRELTPRMVA